MKLSLAILPLFFVFFIFASLITAKYVPLYNYIDRDDGAFSWTDTGRTEVDWLTGATTHFLELTSQRWLDDRYVAQENLLWRHVLAIVEPSAKKGKLDRADTCVLWVTGGKTGNTKLDTSDSLVSGSIADNSRTFSAVLMQVPNQPITFFGQSLSEDRLMGFSWANWMKDPIKTPVESIVNFAMAKAVVKAMDAIEQWSAQRSSPITQFYITGASKRGLTVALAASYEGNKPLGTRRVIGVAPMVYDAFHFSTTLPNMYRYLGAWSFAVEPYRNAGVMNFTHTTEMKMLQTLIDPLHKEYIEGFGNIPTLMIGATGDEFFMLDNTNNFWEDIPGYKHRAVIPNADHPLFTNLSAVIDSLTGHINTLLYTRDKLLPQITWSVLETGELFVKIIDDKFDADSYHVQKIEVFHAYNSPNKNAPMRRDFRMLRMNIPGSCDAPNVIIDDAKCLAHIPWNATTITHNPNITSYNEAEKMWTVHYIENLERKPEDVYVGFFVSIEFEMQKDIITSDGTVVTRLLKQKYTTNPVILPNIIPYEMCPIGNCFGTMV